MTSETTGGGGSSGGGGGYAGESSGGEETGKGLKEWWNKFKAGKGGQSVPSTPATGISHNRAREVPYQSTSTGKLFPSTSLGEFSYLSPSSGWIDEGRSDDDHSRSKLTSPSLPPSLPFTSVSILTAPTEGRPVFSMPLSEAITYASITISTPGPDGTFYVWGVVPTVVARWFVQQPFLLPPSLLPSSPSSLTRSLVLVGLAHVVVGT